MLQRVDVYTPGGLKGQHNFCTASTLVREIMFLNSHATHHFAILQGYARERGQTFGSGVGTAPATVANVLGYGVPAESPHAHHPGTPLLDGYRAMFHQWSIAFEIGTAYARSGVATTSAVQLLRQFRQDLRRSETWF